jgi:tricorn protease
MIKSTLSIFLVLVVTAISLGQSEQPLLLQKPTLSRDHIAFVYGGDLWIVGREGGEAKRLTTGIGIETRPYFSPDGSRIAFTGEYDGNVDAFVIPASGGIPSRLTYHPDSDEVLGWTPDGKQVLFRSSRHSYSFFNRFFTIPVTGGFPTEIPLPMAEEGSYSPDGARMAYVPIPQWQAAWKRYRGGQTKPIWIVNLFDSSVIEKIPRDNSNDFNPMWVGQTIYFLSDRNGPVTLFAYDLNTKQVTLVVQNDGFDLKSACAGPGAIVYEQFGALYLHDLASGQSQRIDVRVVGDFSEVRPYFQKVKANNLSNTGLSPTGARAVFQARGEIVSVPAEKGDIRNLTRTTNVAERDPAWSPDGKWIAYFSDESGEYALHLRDQSGLGEVRKINLGEPPSFFYSPRWSPDSKKIAYTDKRLNLWYLEIDKPTPVLVDTDIFESPFRTLEPVWSPDNRWLAYTKHLPNHLHAVLVYSLEDKKSRQLTDGMSDALYPAFDKSGKHLYFTASTDIGLAAGWLDMSSLNRPVTRSVYVVVLKKDLPSPLAPESDEEKDTTAVKSEAGSTASKEKSAKKAEKKEEQKEGVTVQIDFDNLSQRILALPIPARNYLGISAGKEGILFLLEGAPVLWSPSDGPPVFTLHKFDLSERKTDTVLEGINAFTLSANGEKMLYLQGEKWFIASATETPKAGEGELKLDELEVYVDPRVEWNQMYHEVWRIQRDFLYDPGFHGLDLNAAEKKYAPFLANIVSRVDLNYLFEEMLGELSLGHVFVWGGESPEAKKVKVGLLGADYKIENGRYRFARVYNGENWNPQLRAPLTQPGVNVVAGEYLLAINGREVNTASEVYSYFEGTAGKSVVIKVGPNPDGTSSREVTVVPVENEIGLRNLAWIEDNRRKVDELSAGRLAYVYLPNTAGAGYTNFNRYYFAQVGKEGAVIDERFNGGGFIADYIIDYLRRPIMSMMTTREGQDFSSPLGSIYGPKAMIINEMAGSGGDAMPWYFRKAGLGLLVGKKTWGGLVGIYDYPPLMDGGGVTAPRIALYGLNGEWEVENVGIAPDIEVELDPKLVREGHDPQLEKAVEVVLELLKKNPLPQHKKPAYPNYHLRK